MLIKEATLRKLIINLLNESDKPLKLLNPTNLTPSQTCYDGIWKHESPVPYIYDDGRKMSESLADKKYGNIVKGSILQNIIKNKWPAGKMPYPSSNFADNKGYPTIGAGHLIKNAAEFETFKDYTLDIIASEENRKANSSIPLQDFLMSESEMKELFKKDVDIHTQFKKRITANITQSMFDSLVSIAYNAGWEQKRPIQKIINLINKKQYKQAQEQIKNLAVTSKGEVMQGLVNRRKEESELFGKDGIPAA
jgi:GH24 family phage-related lysozyme (muramidase)